MSHPASTENNYPSIQRALGLADMASIFEFAASQLLAIWMTLDTSNLVTSSKVRYIMTRYLMWEGDVFISPWVNYCEGMGISPPLSRNLRFFVGMLGMSQTELLNYQEFYDAFMKLLAVHSGTWVTGRIVKTYPMAWWNEAFDTVDYKTFTTTLPNFGDIKAMANSHFEQLPEGCLLVTPATLVDSRSTLVAQQLANIHAGTKQEGDQIITLLENKVVEAWLVAASLLRMETALGQDSAILETTSAFDPKGEVPKALLVGECEARESAGAREARECTRVYAETRESKRIDFNYALLGSKWVLFWFSPLSFLVVWRLSAVMRSQSATE
ncbi:uncharacterized protein F5147DRAFT_656579 [Suillus discolor]|uniref:Uncharacterized protein n=1 Tax=Suillus discolor TaxID=1912936 RepID=A0A9P7EY14_9AGAM|nr:uncharacterized protein F5147DRAFT_656579 [Suillus discolor]KAG2096504.1 hypothetical protein F5147DRAFT_656579 [Suillus discolor]